MSRFIAVTWRWLRRFLSIFAGIVVVNIVVLTISLIVYRSINREWMHFIDSARPWTALVGAILGIWIVARAEKKEAAKRKPSLANQ